MKNLLTFAMLVFCTPQAYAGFTAPIKPVAETQKVALGDCKQFKDFELCFKDGPLKTSKHQTPYLVFLARSQKNQEWFDYPLQKDSSGVRFKGSSYSIKVENFDTTSYLVSIWQELC